MDILNDHTIVLDDITRFYQTILLCGRYLVQYISNTLKRQAPEFLGSQAPAFGLYDIRFVTLFFRNTGNCSNQPE